MSKPRILSGMQPSGKLHVGNYLGALKQFVDLQETHEAFFMLADYHALNSVQDAETLKEYTLDLAASYVAAGIDPDRSVIFKQSDVPEHTELTWIFNTLTTMPYLMRAHAFKDAEVKNKEVSVGKFDYPMLMAADILLYDPDVVPVGKDQKQHIEFARDAADKFNRTYSEVFKLPKEHIPEEVATVPGTDGEKMSKSYNNTIPLFGTDEEIDTAVMRIVSDSTPNGEPLDTETDVTFKLHEHFSKDQLEDLRRRYQEGSIGYKESKEILAENIKSLIRPMREKKEALLANPDTIKNILSAGGEKARAQASEKMTRVRKAIGVTL